MNIGLSLLEGRAAQQNAEHALGITFDFLFTITDVAADHFIAAQRMDLLDRILNPVFDGPEDYRARIDQPGLGIDERTILVIRGTGPIGYPGGAEVVNMHPPAALIRAGIDALPCIGDGRQSGTSGSPSILNASPEAAAGGGLALLRTGDRIRIDLRRREVNVLVDAEELTRRRTLLGAQGGYVYPPSQTPWQEIQRNLSGQFDGGAVLESAVKFQRLAQTAGTPRDSH